MQFMHLLCLRLLLMQARYSMSVAQQACMQASGPQRRVLEHKNKDVACKVLLSATQIACMEHNRMSHWACTEAQGWKPLKTLSLERCPSDQVCSALCPSVKRTANL